MPIFQSGWFRCSLLLVALCALKPHRRFIASSSGHYVMSLVEVARSFFISLSVSSSAAILTARAKSLTPRLPSLVQPWAQVTTRLFEAVQAIGLATSGELGTRLADRIGMYASPTTMLRRIMALASPSSLQVSLLGRDDWSFRRGRTFGTILVDLMSHSILDLLASSHCRDGGRLDEKAPRN